MVISGGNFSPDILKPKEVVSLLLDDDEMERKREQWLYCTLENYFLRSIFGRMCKQSCKQSCCFRHHLEKLFQKYNDISFQDMVYIQFYFVDLP